VRLTPTEFELLALLLRRAGKVCTFAEIMNQLWPDGVGGSEAAVHTYVWQLRQKLERNPAQPGIPRRSPRPRLTASTAPPSAPTPSATWGWPTASLSPPSTGAWPLIFRITSPAS
jgi:hypothetical protein